jgi:hypothetical protein
MVVQIYFEITQDFLKQEIDSNVVETLRSYFKLLESVKVVNNVTIIEGGKKG